MPTIYGALQRLQERGIVASIETLDDAVYGVDLADLDHAPEVDNRLPPEADIKNCQDYHIIVKRREHDIAAIRSR